ncbi:UNKNOWN [Stylonychia lemnae]|uniref:VWFA domain-containing protein n=1 Tax=Stylonychia lemnae TaxID=5949 RepID=A0A078AXC4_STYLE|nr:UNKNOWN [Stylonychia lemnae]|eukprot:CDW86824.1 UNKNOWN [Stylonychia lemnae]
MYRNPFSIFIILSLISISLAQTPDQCKQCAADPCGCQLFKCSKTLEFPSNTQDLSKGFSGCQQTDGQLVDGDIIQQLQGICSCPYVNIDENCKPIGNSGIMLGSGFELTGQNTEDLKKLGLNEKLLAKLSPYFAKYENPVQYLMNNQVEFSQQEIENFQVIMMGSEISNLQKYYDKGLYSKSQYGKLSKERTKFSELSKGVRTVIYSQDRQYGKPDNFQNMWNYALRVDFQKMLDQLAKEGKSNDRSLSEYYILKFCMEKCSESKKVNILFVMDGSGSINNNNPNNFKTQTDFVRNIIQSTKLGDDSYQIGLLLFSDINELLSDFSSNQAALINALNKMKYPAGNTYTNQALIEAKRLFQQQSIRRPDSLNIMFVLTDGIPSDTILDSTIQDLKDQEVQRYAVGIGSGIQESTLMYISGDNKQDKSRVYQVKDFDKLQSLINSLNVAACSTPQDVKITQPSFQTSLDGQGSQYFQFLQKYVSLTIIVKDLVQTTSLFLTNYQLSLAQELQSSILEDVEVYYSFTYDMPNQYINDGQGEQKDGKISLVINNDKTNTSKIYIIQNNIISLCNFEEEIIWQDQSLCQLGEFTISEMRRKLHTLQQLTLMQTMQRRL